jgi:hypothetical protein
LQNYYGLSVPENLNDVDEMAKAIEAPLYHVASTDDNPQNDLCPVGAAIEGIAIITNTGMAFQRAL